jgi:hypothetical protein
MPSRSDFDPSRATLAELVQEVLRLRADLAIIAANVVQQAIEREWCGEYEQWARITNKQCSRPHMIDRYEEELRSQDTLQVVELRATRPAGFVDGACNCRRTRTR